MLMIDYLSSVWLGNYLTSFHQCKRMDFPSVKFNLIDYFSFLFIGIFISIGPIIDEVQEYNYMNNRNCSKARQLLLIIWLFVGFTLTLSYKEVLIANLVKVGYEDTIENFDHLLESGKPLIVPQNTYVPFLLFNDPRAAIKNWLLLENIVYINHTGDPKEEEWIFNK